MTGPDYRLIGWRTSSDPELDQSERGEQRVRLLLADGWQLHGGPLAFPGDRVLQAMVKPAAAERDAMLAAVQAIANVAQTMAVVRARLSGEDAKP